MFPETKSRISMVEGNIEIFRKQNSLFPSGPVIKCLLFYEESVSWLSIVQTRKIICYIAGVFFRYSAPIHWLVHCHMASNNEAVSRQMP